MRLPRLALLCALACVLAVTPGPTLASQNLTPIPLTAPSLLQDAWAHVQSYRGTFSGQNSQQTFQGSVTLRLVPTIPRDLNNIQFQGNATTSVTWNEGSCGSGKGSSNHTLVLLTVHLRGTGHHKYDLLVGGPGDVTIRGSTSNGCPQPPDNVFHTPGFDVVASLQGPALGVCGTQKFSEGGSYTWKLVPTTDDSERISVRCFDVPPTNTGQ